MLKNIKDGILLWLVFSLMIPVVISIWNILFVGILGMDSALGFIGNFEKAWISYYFSGELFGFIAWRIHLFLLTLSLLFTFLR